MKSYIKDGRFYNGRSIIVVTDDGAYTIFNPDEATLIANGWTEYVEPEPTEEELFEQAKLNKLTLIRSYDSGTNVNSFIVKVEGGEDITDWLTPELRANYRSSIEAAELLGVENLSLYVGGKEFELPTQTAKLMLARILLYADLCFLVTKRHIAAIEELETTEAIYNYDITSGYPEKIVFTL